MMRSAQTDGRCALAGSRPCNGELNRDANQLIARITSLPDEVSCLIVRGGD